MHGSQSEGSRWSLQDLFTLLRPEMQRLLTLEEACVAAAALEAQLEGGLEAIEEVPSDEEDGETGSESGHSGRGRLGCKLTYRGFDVVRGDVFEVDGVRLVAANQKS